jgi:hypothetical protein
VAFQRRVRQVNQLKISNLSAQPPSFAGEKVCYITQLGELRQGFCHSPQTAGNVSHLTFHGGELVTHNSSAHGS